jgi:hypothetical protein
LPLANFDQPAGTKSAVWRVARPGQETAGGSSGVSGLGLARFSIIELFNFHFNGVDSLFLEQAIQLVETVIVEMIIAGYQIPSDRADNGGAVLYQDFRKWRFRIALVNHWKVLSVTLNETMRCIQA